MREKDTSVEVSGLFSGVSVQAVQFECADVALGHRVLSQAEVEHVAGLGNRQAKLLGQFLQGEFAVAMFGEVLDYLLVGCWFRDLGEAVYEGADGVIQRFFGAAGFVELSALEQGVYGQLRGAEWNRQSAGEFTDGDALDGEVEDGVEDSLWNEQFTHGYLPYRVNKVFTCRDDKRASENLQVASRVLGWKHAGSGSS